MVLLNRHTESSIAAEGFQEAANALCDPSRAALRKAYPADRLYWNGQFGEFNLVVMGLALRKGRETDLPEKYSGVNAAVFLVRYASAEYSTVFSRSRTIPYGPFDLQILADFQAYLDLTPEPNDWMAHADIETAERLIGSLSSHSLLDVADQ